MTLSQWWIEAGCAGVAVRALDTLAESYDWQARRQDEDSERLDWES